MKLIKISAVVFMLVLSVSGLQAHSPDEISLKFARETGTVTINVNHGVQSTESHYVRKLTVYLNGDAVIKQQFMTQRDNKGQKAIYYIPGADSEDIIKIEAECSISGSETKEVSIDQLIKKEKDMRMDKENRKMEKEEKIMEEEETK